ncbi:MAG TPA: glycosyl hydrolase family 28-related protein [Candidatus Synoicihabitans sp.]|nr:glycosyl hydrolase family 28-related protein [Candidatus Synoicihabitans sp.]
MTSSPSYNVRDFGAVGDGRTIDSPAINAAIDAAAAAGGGTVLFPAGIYASYTVRLRSRVTLQLTAGATLLAATPPADEGAARGERSGYDAAEPNEWGDVHRYQDFGHSHWRNSLIWGEQLEDVAILGPGRIDGRGLHKGLAADLSELEGVANKAIGLKQCRRVLLRDFTLDRGGHFAVLTTGVDQLTINNLTIDTQRDGLDIDACRFVTITNCRINTPNDDAIVLKTSHALGARRATEQVTISNCVVSGYDLGTVLDGTYGRSERSAPDGDGPTGRIKLGTESHGDFRDITIANCIFVRSRGLAIESVDGAVIENIAVSNLVMREIVSAPLFLRLGARLRGPAGTAVGAIRRVQIDNLVVDDADCRFAALISGLPGHRIENVSISNVRVGYRGGLTLAQVAAQPTELISTFFQRGPDAGTGARQPFAVPERPAAYPEPSMFGLLPAYGLYARHVEGLQVRDVRLTLASADDRPAVVLEDVRRARFEHLEAPRPADQPLFVLREVEDFSAWHCGEAAEVKRRERTTEELR